MQNPAPLTLGPDLSHLFGADAWFTSARTLAGALFALVVFLVIIYTLIAVYHWVRYGHRSIIAIPAIAAHIFVSLALIGFAATGLQ